MISLKVSNHQLNINRQFEIVIILNAIYLAYIKTRNSYFRATKYAASSSLTLNDALGNAAFALIVENEDGAVSASMNSKLVIVRYVAIVFY